MTVLDSRSKDLRRKILKTMAAGKQGHPLSAFSLVEILRVLFDNVLRYDARRPQDPDRDILILSKGHGYLALYALLAEKGFFPEDELWKFAQPGGILGVHPSHTIPGVEVSTGALGHGLSIGVGMALANRNRRVYVVLGDGECQEGAVWEAAMCAAKHKLDNLTAIIDYNGQQATGSLEEIQPLEPIIEKWSAFGWFAMNADGHDLDYLRELLVVHPLCSHMPAILICHTVKGKGIPSIERNLAWHHRRVTAEEGEALIAELEQA